MRIRRIVLWVAVAAAGAGMLSGFTQAGPRGVGAGPGVAATATGAAAQPSPVRAGCSAADFRGDKRLGPQKLPDSGLLGNILHAYRRTGGLPAPAFLARYWNSGAGAGRGWIYPPAAGFVVGLDGRPDEIRLRLLPGEDIDRFGSEHGAFLSPEGMPYALRSLPPQNLDGIPPRTCNYHDYRVIRKFLAQAGPAAPWFGQPGYGLQYQLDPALIAGAPKNLSVGWLISHGYLMRLSRPRPA
jgi:hypothetical protein